MKHQLFFYITVSLSSQHGLIALITILVISAVTIFIALSSNLLGISEAKTGLKKESSSNAFVLATACGEEVLLRLKNDFTYTLVVPENVSIDSGSCTVVSVTGSGTKEIRVEATVENTVKRLKIFVTKPVSTLVIDSWDEVADF